MKEKLLENGRHLMRNLVALQLSCNAKSVHQLTLFICMC